MNLNRCSGCGDPYLPATEAHMIENLCSGCLFDPNRSDVELCS